MNYRKLGHSQIKVSEIGFGAWTIALDWWGKKIEKSEAIAMIKKAYDLGVNFFETSDMYGKGKSETLLGEALAGCRNDIVLSTKFGYDFLGVEQIGHKELPQSFSAEFTNRALESSLERLGTDHVDVYGLHNPKIRHIQDDSIFQTMDLLKSSGKIRTCQIALGPAIGWLREGLDAMERTQVSAIQTVYNILEQTPGNELVSKAQEKDVGILVRVPDASGILTGKVGVHTKIDQKDHRSVRKGEWIKASLEKLKELEPIAQSNGLRIDELAIKFLLAHDSVSSVLPTIVSIKELETFVAMSNSKTLPDSDMTEIARLYASWPSYELKE